MKFYAIALLIATASAKQSTINGVTQGLVDGIAIDKSQVSLDQSGLTAAAKNLKDIKADHSYTNPVQIKMNSDIEQQQLTKEIAGQNYSRTYYYNKNLSQAQN